MILMICKLILINLMLNSLKESQDDPQDDYFSTNTTSEDGYSSFDVS